MAKVNVCSYSKPNHQGLVQVTGMRTEKEVHNNLISEMSDTLSDCEWVVGPSSDRVLPDNYSHFGCFAKPGNNEGDMACVYMVSSQGNFIHLLTAKTFMGNDHAWQIAKQASELLHEGL